MKIAVAGIGYVGLSMAVLLAEHNRVTAVDVLPERVDMITARRSPLGHREIEEYLSKKELSLTATTDAAAAYREAELVVIATPTDYDSEKNSFDTSSVEQVIAAVLAENPQAVMVIKSTVPVGFTEEARARFLGARRLFSPEFLREGRALYDNLNPSRIIVGVPAGDAALQQSAEQFAALLRAGAKKEDVDVLFMEPTEAEAVKLFSNT